MRSIVGIDQQSGVFYTVVVAFLLMLLTACGEYDDEDTPNKPSNYILLPPSENHPQGLIEFRIKSRLYRIPKEFVLTAQSGIFSPFMYEMSWPNLLPIEDKSIGRARRPDLIRLRFLTASGPRTDVPDEKFEKIVIKRHQQPVQLRDFPKLQEYPSGGSFPHYRGVDISNRWDDGLPPYFYCMGPLVANGNDILDMPPRLSCTIQLSWPDGVLLNIEFKKQKLAHWREIHDRTIDWLKSYRVELSS